jgi:hypothetical protein
MTAGMQREFSSETTARVLITNTWDNVDHGRLSIALGLPSTEWGGGLGVALFGQNLISGLLNQLGFLAGH